MVENAALTGYNNKMIKLRSIISGLILSFATISWMVVSWGVYELTTNGLDAIMMGYEVMPVGRHDQIRSSLIRESLPGNLVVGGILLVIGIFIGWRWRLFFRSVRRHRTK